MKYHELSKMLHEESKKHGWGLILIARNELKQIIDQYKPFKILEIGCHNRLLERTLREWNFKGLYVGLDVVKYDVNPDVLGSGDQLPFRDNYFDLIVMLETLEHILDYVRCLKECHRVLRKNGLLFIQSVICYDRCAYNGDESHYHTLHPNCLKRLCRLIGLEHVANGLINATFWILFKKVK